MDYTPVNKRFPKRFFAAVVAGIFAALLCAVIYPAPSAYADQACWKKTSGTWYYLESAGEPKTGWLKTGGKWYYLDAKTGAMKTGWVQVEGKWYYLNSSGAMQTGWLKRGKSWYHLGGSGAMTTGWKKSAGKWYFLDTKSGAMKTGWVDVNGTWYYLDSSGAMQTGWLKRGKTWYYLAGSGAMQTDWQNIKGTWYFFDIHTGAMYANMIKDGYYLSSSGAMISQALRSYVESSATATKTKQIVLVVGHQLTLWQKQSDGSWVNYVDFYCGYGRNGLANANTRTEGDGTTPIGSFPIPYAFGNSGNPGTKMSYYRTTNNSYWSAEKKTYNTWIESASPIRGEHLASIYQYKYAAVIGFNMDPAVYKRGSAFFLHCKSTDTWSTAGCVSLKEADMVQVLKFLKNGAYILIVPNKGSISSY